MTAERNKRDSLRETSRKSAGRIALAPLALALAACSGHANDIDDDARSSSGRFKAAAPVSEPVDDADAATSAPAPSVAVAPAFVRTAPSPAGVSAHFRLHSRGNTVSASALPACTPLSSAGNDACSDRHGAIDSFHRAAHTAVAGRGLLSIAGGGVQVEDPVPGLSMPLVVLHADIPADAVAFAAGGTVTYTSASTGRWTAFAASEDGIEDFSYFPTAPDDESLDLQITVPAGAGLRLVGGELSVLDTNGTPRARAAPPSIVGADGTTAPATLSILDCAFDASPIAPWGRPIVAPGQSVCHVRIAWSGADVGGYPLVVDPSWSYAASMATARWSHTATLIANGRVLVTGGQGPSSALRSVEIYDPTSATWAATGSMTAARSSQTATLLTSGTEVLIAGGDNGSVSLASAELYSQTSGTWSSAGTMSTSRDYHQAFALDTTHVLVAGGVSFGATGAETTLATTEIYNRTSGTWATIGSLSQPRAFAVGIFAGSSSVPLVAGGDNGTSALTTFDLYVKLTQTWIATTGMLHVHENATGFGYGTGNNLFVAGGTDFSGAPIAACEEYNLTLGIWGTSLSLVTARGILASAATGTNFALIGGGSSATTSLASTEIFNPTANSISAGATLQRARWGHTATTLATGAILVAGGLDASTSAPIASTELYQ